MKVLSKAAGHRIGRVLTSGIKEGTFTKLIELGLVERDGWFYGALWKISDKGRAVVEASRAANVEKKTAAQLDAEIAEALQGKPTKPARLSKAARMKLGAALRRSIQNEKILTGAYRSMRHDDYQRAGEAAIEASGLYGRAAAQASDDGVEIFEIVDGAPHVDQGALVRWDEEP
jgi:hypothetical protein